MTKQRKVKLGILAVIFIIIVATMASCVSSQNFSDREFKSWEHEKDKYEHQQKKKIKESSKIRHDYRR